MCKNINIENNLSCSYFLNYYFNAKINFNRNFEPNNVIVVMKINSFATQSSTLKMQLVLLKINIHYMVIKSSYSYSDFNVKDGCKKLKFRFEKDRVKVYSTFVVN